MEAMVYSRRKFEPLMTIVDINKLAGREIFILVQKLADGIDYIGCESIKELGDYAAEMTSIDGDGCSILLIRGFVQNIINLPFEAEIDDEIFVVHDTLTLRRFDKMTQAVSFIEYIIRESPRITIDSSLIITGRSLPMGTVSSFMTRVGMIRSMAV